MNQKSEYSEEDVFMALKRISFQDMRTILVNYRLSIVAGLSVMYTSTDHALVSHGWTQEEYIGQLSMQIGIMKNAS